MDKFYNKLEEIIEEMRQSKTPLQLSYQSYYLYESLKQEGGVGNQEQNEGNEIQN